MKNLLIAQSGGPTAAINATLVGAMQAATTSEYVDTVYGAVNGIQGIIEERFLNLSESLLNTVQLRILAQTPAAALGSCRFKLDSVEENEGQYEQIISIFRKYEIRYFVYIGGNDSMDTVNKINQYCVKKGINDIFVMGAPKTIDNDLVETDHCPGFGSAAKYIATTVAELERDISVYQTSGVTIVEIMGRNAGWLTGAAALPRLNGNKGPDFVYLCEVPFDLDQFLIDVKKKLDETGSVFIAVSEGIHNKDGQYISELLQSKTEDVFGHKYIAGAGKNLEELVREKFGCKARSIELNLMQRCAGHITSATDISESKLLGMKAVQSAVEGKTGEMTTIVRNSSNPYDIYFSTVPVARVANKEKKVPLEWISKEKNNVEQPLLEYLEPLIQGECNITYENGMPVHLVLYNRNEQK